VDKGAHSRPTPASMRGRDIHVIDNALAVVSFTAAVSCNSPNPTCVYDISRHGRNSSQQEHMRQIHVAPMRSPPTLIFFPFAIRMGKQAPLRVNHVISPPFIHSPLVLRPSPEQKKKQLETCRQKRVHGCRRFAAFPDSGTIDKFQRNGAYLALE